MTDRIRYSGLIEPANEMLLTDATDEWEALAKLEAMLTGGNRVTALVRIRVDEFNGEVVSQVPLPLPPRDQAPIVVDREWVQAQQRAAARAGWMRGFAFRHWMDNGGRGRDDIPDALAADMNEWCPYPADPSIPATRFAGQVPGVDTETHWANGAPRLLRPEAYERLSAERAKR